MAALATSPPGLSHLGGAVAQPQEARAARGENVIHRHGHDFIVLRALDRTTGLYKKSGYSIVCSRAADHIDSDFPTLWSNHPFKLIEGGGQCVAGSRSPPHQVL